MKVVRKDMKCPKCLKEIPEDNFCGFCGAKLREKCECWVLKRHNYSCCEEGCPGYGLLIKLAGRR